MGSSSRSDLLIAERNGESEVYHLFYFLDE